MSIMFKHAQWAKPSSMELTADVAPLVEFRTKTEMAYEQLRRWIVAGRLAPGQRLDQEWLAAELRVSRMPLRQALLRLEADGLIQNEPHRSAIVASLSLAELTDVEREAVLLVAWDGLVPADAARVAGCSRNAFDARLHRARRRLERSCAPSPQPGPIPSVCNQREARA